jgi:hypothetical protein
MATKKKETVKEPVKKVAAVAPEVKPKAVKKEKVQKSRTEETPKTPELVKAAVEEPVIKEEEKKYPKTLQERHEMVKPIRDKIKNKATREEGLKELKAFNEDQKNNPHLPDWTKQ